MQSTAQIPHCPVLYPTEQQFSDFYAYVHYLDQTYKKDHGMVKVVPPPSWSPCSKTRQIDMNSFMVKHAIEQNVQGRGGYFQSKNIVQQKMNFKAYKRYAISQSAGVKGKTVQEKQQLFWKTLTYSPPIYGADCTGTLMDQNAKAWNMNCLDSILKYSFTENVKGVNTPFCYIGTWKAFFSWHKQDFDLAAINYIHQGQSKVWYSIALCDCHILQEQARIQFKSRAQECSQFLRHKTYLINPYVLLKKYPNLKITKNVQNERQFTLVFGGAYHQGFNCGFNVAQAVNYATVDWLTQMIPSKSCTCIKRSAKVDKESVLYNLQNSQIFQQLLQTAEFKVLRNTVLLQQQFQQDQKKIIQQNKKGQEQKIEKINEEKQEQKIVLEHICDNHKHLKPEALAEEEDSQYQIRFDKPFKEKPIYKSKSKEPAVAKAKDHHKNKKKLLNQEQTIIDVEHLG